MIYRLLPGYVLLKILFLTVVGPMAVPIKTLD